MAGTTARRGRRVRLPKFEITSQLTAIILATIFLFFSSHGKGQSNLASDTFTDNAASKLLGQVAEGLNGHSVKKLLGAFDLPHMSGGPIFREQITAFFNRYDNLRVRFKLVDVSDNVAVVDAEMEETPRGSDSPPQHKSMELRFTAQKEAAGWKFIEVQPRAFFSF